MLSVVEDNSPPGQFAPDNSPPIFKQLALCSFIHYRAKQDVKCMEPRLNAIEIILRSLIHYQTNNSSFFYPLPSLKFGGDLSGANCPGGELSDIRCRSSVCGILRETVGTALRGTSFLRSKVYKWGLNCGPEVSLESVWKHNDCVSIEAAGAVAAGFAP